MSQAWLGVVSRAHVWRGVEQGFAQVCHGKVKPLCAMKRGDIFVYYSPTVEMHGAPLKAFTALGTIQDDVISEYNTGNGFVPFRRRVQYVQANEVPLEDVRGALQLCAQPSWGTQLRRGLIALTEHDIGVIAGAMGVNLAALKT